MSEAQVNAVNILQQRPGVIDNLIGGHQPGQGVQTQIDIGRLARNGSAQGVTPPVLVDPPGISSGPIVNDPNVASASSIHKDMGRGGIFNGVASYLLPLGFIAATYIARSAETIYNISNYGV